MYSAIYITLLKACIRFMDNIPSKHHDLSRYYACSHILPIIYRINYKLCLMVYKILNNLAPEYLSDPFHVYKPFCKNLRSENDHTIINTGYHIEKTIFHKMCVIWNSLLVDLRPCNHLNVFKKNLKTYYFRTAFKV